MSKASCALCHLRCLVCGRGGICGIETSALRVETSALRVSPVEGSITIEKDNVFHLRVARLLLHAAVQKGIVLERTRAGIITPTFAH